MVQIAPIKKIKFLPEHSKGLDTMDKQSKFAIEHFKFNIIALRLNQIQLKITPITLKKKPHFIRVFYYKHLTSYQSSPISLDKKEESFYFNMDENKAFWNNIPFIVDSIGFAPEGVLDSDFEFKVEFLKKKKVFGLFSKSDLAE